MTRAFLVKLITLLIFTGMLTTSLPLFAQQHSADTQAQSEKKHHSGKRGQHHGFDRALMSELIPPRMALMLKDEINLSETQQQQLQELVHNVKEQRQHNHNTMRQETGALKQLLAAPTIDRQAALDQADKVFALESRFKRARLEQMIAAKNILTPEQVDQIKELRKEHRYEKRQRKQRRGKY